MCAGERGACGGVCATRSLMVARGTCDARVSFTIPAFHETRGVLQKAPDPPKEPTVEELHKMFLKVADATSAYDFVWSRKGALGAPGGSSLPAPVMATMPCAPPVSSACQRRGCARHRRRRLWSPRGRGLRAQHRVAVGRGRPGASLRPLHPRLRLPVYVLLQPRLVGVRGWHAGAWPTLCAMFLCP